MKNLRYIFSILPGFLAIAGNILGGYFIYLNILYIFFMLVVLDWLFNENRVNESDSDSDALPDLILYCSSILHITAIATLIISIYNHQLTGKFLYLAAVSTGVNSGVLGIISAHELIHRKLSSSRFLGIINLILVNYGHFYIEHIKGHHKWVGTSKDPATAKRGESIYAFYLRTIPGQFFSAYKIEKERLQKNNQNASVLSNFVVFISLMQILLLFSIGFFLGPKVLLAYLIQSLLAILLLEYVNYIEHYGLERKTDEKFSALHAWQSDVSVSRFSLLELSRHSDHHLKASKKYHLLDTHHESPSLPSGYFGVFYLVLIPPIWFKMVHPIIDKKITQQESN